MKQRLLFAFLWCSSLMLAVARPLPPAATNLPQPVQTTPLQGGDDRSLLVYPNPSTGVIHLTISGFEGRKVEVSVLNIIGTVLYRETLTDLSERATRTLDLTRFANGLYYVKLEGDNTSQLCKLVIH
ncbi:MAG: T9SS type A sorting domain-containing protein [Janthinobacterium lividum]